MKPRKGASKRGKKDPKNDRRKQAIGKKGRVGRGICMQEEEVVREWGS